MALNCNSNLSFTSRCPDIKMGQQVCHIINEYLPHSSTTKFEPFYANYAKKNTGDDKKLYRMFSYRHRSINSLEDARPCFSFDKNNPLKWVNSIIEQLKVSRRGNCGEDAIIADFILKMNGVNNAAQVELKCGNLDHVVCAFNKDGSKVEKVINNKTIIVDPWLGIVDFSNNAFKSYRNICDKYFHFRPDMQKIDILPCRSYTLSPEQIPELSKKYPMFKLPKSLSKRG